MPDAGEVAEQLANAPVAEKQEMKIDQSLLMGEVQILLAERRTALAVLRTGISVSLVPMSIWTVLVATSRLWNPFEIMPLLVTILTFAGLLMILGVYLIVHALQHALHTERALDKVRAADTLLEELLYQHRVPWTGLRW